MFITCLIYNYISCLFYVFSGIFNFFDPRLRLLRVRFLSNRLRGFCLCSTRLRLEIVGEPPLPLPPSWCCGMCCVHVYINLLPSLGHMRFLPDLLHLFLLCLRWLISENVTPSGNQHQFVIFVLTGRYSLSVYVPSSF